MVTVDLQFTGSVFTSAMPRTTLKLGQELLTLPVLDEAVQFNDQSPTWVEVDRPGREPLLRQQKNRLDKIQMTVVFVLPGGMLSVEPGLLKLKRFAGHPYPVQIATGFEVGWWRITDMPFRSTRKHPVTNAIVRAEVTLSLTRDQSPPAIVPGRPPTPPPPASHPTTPPAPVRYTVRRGDTLSSIAVHFYGHAALFTKIAAANRIKNPNLIFPGQVLVIPPR